MLRRFMCFLGLSVLALLLVACDSGPATVPAERTPSSSVVVSSSQTPTPEPHATVGERVTVGTIWVMTMTNVSVSSGDSSYTPAEGKQLLIVAITEENQSKQVASVKGAADWELRDGNGNSYTVVKTAYGEMPVDTVEAGATANGELVYEVPVDIKTFVLTFGLFSGGGSVKNWDIALSS